MSKKLHKKFSSKNEQEMIDFILELKINEFVKLDNNYNLKNLYENLVKNYDINFYILIKNFDINYKELYLDILDMKYNNKEKTLEEFLNQNLDKLENNKMYIEMYKVLIYVENNIIINNLPREIIINIVKDLKYNEILNLCKTNKKLENICYIDNWYYIFKIKYPEFQQYITSLEHAEEDIINYEKLVEELEIFSKFFITYDSKNITLMLNKTITKNLLNIFKILIKDKRITNDILVNFFTGFSIFNNYKAVKLLQNYIKISEKEYKSILLNTVPFPSHNKIFKLLIKNTLFSPEIFNKVLNSSIFYNNYEATLFLRKYKEKLNYGFD